MTIAPVGKWQCAWKDCDQSWAGPVDKTPPDWRWVGDIFTFRRLLLSGAIIREKAIQDGIVVFFTPALCPAHWPLVGCDGLVEQLSPAMFFAAVAKDQLAAKVRS